MTRMCCADCLPAFLSTHLEQQRLELALQRQQAEITRLRFSIELRDLAASFTLQNETVEAKPDPETLSREMILKYEGYSRSMKQARRRTTSHRRSWLPTSSSDSHALSDTSVSYVSKEVQTPHLPSRRSVSISARSPTSPEFRPSYSPEDLPLRESSKLMSLLRESELGPSLKTSRPSISRPVNRMSIESDLVKNTHRTPTKMHQITLEELINSEGKEGFLPVQERDNRLFSEDGSEVTVTSVFGATIGSHVKIYTDIESALRSSNTAIRLTFGDSDSSPSPIRPVEILRRSQKGVSRFALD